MKYRTVQCSRNVKYSTVQCCVVYYRRVAARAPPGHVLLQEPRMLLPVPVGLICIKHGNARSHCMVHSPNLPYSEGIVEVW